MLRAALYIASYKWNIDKIRLAACQDCRELTTTIGQDEQRERSSFSNEMEVAKLAAPPNLEVRFVSCNESVIKRWLSSELEETVFSLTHELFMSQHHTVTLKYDSNLFWYTNIYIRLITRVSVEYDEIFRE